MLPVERDETKRPVVAARLMKPLPERTWLLAFFIAALRVFASAMNSSYAYTRLTVRDEPDGSALVRRVLVEVLKCQALLCAVLAPLWPKLFKPGIEEDRMSDCLVEFTALAVVVLARDVS